ncbi:hypothetical protein KIH74_07115 [Kineosporia sp. J2-2]|uniref:Uncharacterized protein n=1 Tax=Kineosporia corallincola TaxID=2835133 RepID=A0ABS5TC90_9ACTN|nr:hypothetical protein [Kineosporia corallincola]MBT0768690.1 hypothetical protein [Kineosporia corallincola]
MSGTDPAAEPAGRPDPDVETRRRWALNEDWLATAVGLILIVLVLAGVVTDGLVP